MSIACTPCSPTYGDDAMRAAFARGLAEQAIGAEYIAHYLAAAVTTPDVDRGGWYRSSADARSSFLGHPGGSISAATSFTRPAVGNGDRAARRPGPDRRRRPAPRGRSDAERLDAAEPGVTL